MYGEHFFETLKKYIWKNNLRVKKTTEELIKRSKSIEGIIDSESSYPRDRTGYDGLILALYEDLGWIAITENTIVVQENREDSKGFLFDLEIRGGYQHSLLKWNAYLFLKKLNDDAGILFEYSYLGFILDVYDCNNQIVVECGDNAPSKIITLLGDGNIKSLYIFTYYKVKNLTYYYLFSVTPDGQSNIKELEKSFRIPIGDIYNFKLPKFKK